MYQTTYDVVANDFANAGKAATKIKLLLKQLNIPAPLIRNVAVASYEAEINMVIHSLGGEIMLEIDQDKICLCFRDIGPGIDNIELAMTPGYSTANERAREMGFGAGMGLVNMKKVSDEFTIVSTPKGTRIEMSFFV
ncbi:MAG: ATP-binding protein [Erysipelotrichaceae bacterium]